MTFRGWKPTLDLIHLPSIITCMWFGSALITQTLICCMLQCIYFLPTLLCFIFYHVYQCHILSEPLPILLPLPFVSVCTYNHCHLPYFFQRCESFQTNGYPPGASPPQTIARRLQRHHSFDSPMFTNHRRTPPSPNQSPRVRHRTQTSFPNLQVLDLSNYAW